MFHSMSERENTALFATRTNGLTNKQRTYFDSYFNKKNMGVIALLNKETMLQFITLILNY